MEASPIVTVVIPTYRRPHLVVQAIGSVLSQTMSDLEILVVDDCSQDQTRTVVEAISDPRVRYFMHETNKGLPAVRNTGIRLARGRYIAFLDDDDLWHPKKLERQLDALRGYDAVACTAVSSAKGYAMRVHKRPNICLDDLKRGGFAPSSLMARADVLRDVMFDETIRQGEDWDAFIRIAQRYSIGWIAAPLLIYNEGVHPRMTGEAKQLLGPEIEKRNAMLYKHRIFLGERWFNFHLADALLGYIASRPDKLQCIVYAWKRCGGKSVVAALFERLRRRLQRWFWMATVHGYHI